MKKKKTFSSWKKAPSRLSLNPELMESRFAPKETALASRSFSSFIDPFSNQCPQNLTAFSCGSSYQCGKYPCGVAFCSSLQARLLLESKEPDLFVLISSSKGSDSLCFLEEQNHDVPCGKNTYAEISLRLLHPKQWGTLQENLVSNDSLSPAWKQKGHESPYLWVEKLFPPQYLHLKYDKRIYKKIASILYMYILKTS